MFPWQHGRRAGPRISRGVVGAASGGDGVVLGHKRAGEDVAAVNGSDDGTSVRAGLAGGLFFACLLLAASGGAGEQSDGEEYAVDNSDGPCSGGHVFSVSRCATLLDE